MIVYFNSYGNGIHTDKFSIRSYSHIPSIGIFFDFIAYFSEFTKKENLINSKCYDRILDVI